MVEIRFAQNTSDLNNILLLQEKNSKHSISPRERESEGFVTVRHSLAQLKKMQAVSPQIIALQKNELIGFALVMPLELKTVIPALVPLFVILDSLVYKDKPLKELDYYVMGQICVDKNHRGKGVFRKLYAAHRKHLSAKYNYCITEISSSNLRSLNAHLAVGFEVLHSFVDPTDEWTIVLWDWTC